MNNQYISNPWLPVNHPHNDKLNLFCLPFAGGGAESYRSWLEFCDSRIQLCPIDLPGRSRRFDEPLISDLDTLTDAILDGLINDLNVPFAFFGHSMGGLLAYELSLRLRDKQLPLPKAIIISSWQAAHRGPKLPLKHELNRTDFIDWLRELGGTPSEVLNSDELLDLMLPVIRNDFKLIEIWRREPTTPLSIPALIIGGEQDPEVNLADMQAWHELLSGEIEITTFEGGHFYLFKQIESVLNRVTDFLLKQD